MGEAGPSLFSTVRDRRLVTVKRTLRESIEGTAEDLRLRWLMRLEEFVDSAYAAGLQDGFAEGVRAECEAKATRPPKTRGRR